MVVNNIRFTFAKNLKRLIMDKEICEAIRKHFPEHWADKDDNYIMNFCGFYHKIEELIGNKGYYIEEAIKEIKRR